jgi:hypothetical protein
MPVFSTFWLASLMGCIKIYQALVPIEAGNYEVLVKIEEMVLKQILK